ncbi:MAG: GtrA family protein [Actinomycetota bacterium]|nr:GtrA family protein [Actinomycetota bacterium]
MKRYLASFMTKEAFEQFVKVGLVGVANTIVSFALFNAFLWMGWWSVAAVSVAFALTTFMSYLLNRVWTFEIKDGKVSGGETMRFYLVNLAAWAGTAGTMWLAEGLFGPLSKIAANVVYLITSIVILLPKFASYRDIVFGKAIKEKESSPSEA